MPTKWNVAPIYFNNIFPFFGSIVVVGIMIRTRIVHLFAARGFLFMWRRRWQTLEKKKKKNPSMPHGLRGWGSFCLQPVSKSLSQARVCVHSVKLAFLSKPASRCREPVLSVTFSVRCRLLSLCAKLVCLQSFVIYLLSTDNCVFSLVQKKQDHFYLLMRFTRAYSWIIVNVTIFSRGNRY